MPLFRLFENDSPPTKSAFFQARKKIKIQFFEDLLQCAKNVFYQTYNHPKNGIKKWKGFRLMACDGSGFRVPDNKENRQKIGEHKNQHKTLASCKIVAFHDVLNRIFIDIFLHQRSDSELTVVHQNFDKIPKDAIMIYDRAYGDSLLLARHLKSKKHCIIRMKIGGSNVIKEFIASGKKEAIVTYKIGERSYYSAVKKHGLKNNFPKFHPFQIRLVRVELDNGVTEVLATTLLDMECYPHENFKWLYGQRWGVETAFDEVKNQLKLSLFSGYNYQTVLQDIWAVFIFYNIRSLLIFKAEQEIEKSIKSDNNIREKVPPKKLNNSKKRKTIHKYQVNRNIAITIIQTQFFELFQRKTMGKTLEWMIKMIKEHKEPIRDRPTRKRVKKVMRSNSRHHTEKNYKPAF